MWGTHKQIPSVNTLRNIKGFVRILLCVRESEASERESEAEDLTAQATRVSMRVIAERCEANVKSSVSDEIGRGRPADLCCCGEARKETPAKRERQGDRREGGEREPMNGKK